MRFICLWKWLINRGSTRPSRKFRRVGFHYHITVKQSDYKEGSKTPGAQTVASASAWKDGTGYGSKIDKNAGKVTNQLEVIADANVGFIRYYQDKWEQTITAASSLQNTVVFPYAKVIQLTKEIHQEVPWKKTFSGYEKTIQETMKRFVRH